jgi:hypothetical protein
MYVTSVHLTRVRENYKYPQNMTVSITDKVKMELMVRMDDSQLNMDFEPVRGLIFSMCTVFMFSEVRMGKHLPTKPETFSTGIEHLIPR